MDDLDWSGIDVYVPNAVLADCPACVGIVVLVVSALIVALWCAL